MSQQQAEESRKKKKLSESQNKLQSRQALIMMCSSEQTFHQ